MSVLKLLALALSAVSAVQISAVPAQHAKLVFLRHGQSTWNQLNLFTGWVDVPLSELGVEEATAGGQEIKKAGLKFDVAYTSLLQRAQETCRMALEESEQTTVNVIQDWRHTWQSKCPCGAYTAPHAHPPAYPGQYCARGQNCVDASPFRCRGEAALVPGCLTIYTADLTADLAADLTAFDRPGSMSATTARCRARTRRRPWPSSARRRSRCGAAVTTCLPRLSCLAPSTTPR